MTKKCTKCGIEYPRTREFFYSDKKAKDGLYSWCKKCKCVYVIIWQKRTRKKRRECDRKYHQTLRGYAARLMDNVKTRCTNENCLSYKDYGGRGIRCMFTADELYNWLIVNNINPRGLEIHRIDFDGNYTLDNIEFLGKSAHLKLHHSKRRQNDERDKN